LKVNFAGIKIISQSGFSTGSLAITYKGDIAVYTKHSKLLLRYPDSQKIWRYMSLDRFKSLIEKESLFFCRADQFNDDKWEGIFPIKMIKKFGLDTQSFPSDDGKTYTNCEWHIQKEARSHLINCWHVNDSESFAMWKIYGRDQQDAIAIQSTIGCLKNSFSANNERIWIGEVEYIDFRDWEPENRFFNSDIPNTLKTFFLKWNYFAYEKEIRAVINKSYNEHKSDKGIPIKVDLCELIEKIYIPAVADPKIEKEVVEFLENTGYSFSMHRSDLGVPLYM
jgi:hypothetical protein